MRRCGGASSLPINHNHDPASTSLLSVFSGVADEINWGGNVRTNKKGPVAGTSHDWVVHALPIFIPRLHADWAGMPQHPQSQGLITSLALI